jgi:phage FluMu gp28-like protein
MKAAKRRINYTRPFVYNYQRQILDDPARYTVTEASTKVGKTASHIIWLFEESLKLKFNQSVWWVAPVYAQAEIAFSRMKQQVTNRGFFRANESKLRLTLPTGAHIQFKSADKPDNLYGDDVYAAVFDEFTRAKEPAWHALRSTLTFTKGRCKFIGNVKGKKNWGYKLAMKAKAKDPGFSHYRITAYDAAAEGLLTYEEIEAAKAELPENVFRELYMAEAADDGSNPFGLEHIGKCVHPLSTLPPVCFGIDLAKSVDYTVITGLDMFGMVCYFDRFRKDWTQTTAAIKALPDLPMSIDSTGVGDPIVEELQRLHQYIEAVKFTSHSKQQMMEGLAWAIQNEKVAYPDGIVKDELEIFEFFYSASGVKYSAPAGFHDDTVCSLALAWRCYQNNRSLGQYTLS